LYEKLTQPFDNRDTTRRFTSDLADDAAIPRPRLDSQYILQRAIGLWSFTDVDFPTLESSTVDIIPITTTMLSPTALCLLRAEDVQLLSQSEGFNFLRRHLSDNFDYGYVAST
jgi:hypothetical protein